MRLKASLIPILMTCFCMTQISCNQTAETPAGEPSTNQAEELQYRPNFHFTPEKNWMNDPNGMFFLNGIYHLYFQYYPEGNVWGPMHWGHATSKDLVQWKEEPIAIYPDSLGYIFSGSAVVDTLNSSGLGMENDPAVVAIYTYHDPEGDEAGRIDFQTQAIAYSHDEGFNWTKYDGNPVISNPGIRDFRDPKVNWDEDNQQWVMALAVKDVNYFYGSKNLVDWEFLSEFGKDIGAHGGVWECPDFFKIRVEDTESHKWVLLQSLNPGGPNGGSGTQYFVGDWDGQTFTLDPEFENHLNQNGPAWLDFGRDNYAGVSWSNVPDGRRLFIGWMSNWDYAQVVPTTTWRSAMTIARELKLNKSPEGYYVSSHPVTEFDRFKKADYIYESGRSLVSDKSFSSSLNPGNSHLVIELEKLGRSVVKFELKNSKDESLVFGIDNTENMFFLDRRRSGSTDFSEKFADRVSSAAYSSDKSSLNMEVFIDKTSIEVFFDEGKYPFTEIFFPSEPFSKFRIITEGDEVVITKLVINSIDL